MLMERNKVPILLNSHNEIHQGDHYRCTANIPTATAAVLLIAFKSPTSTKLKHLFVEWWSESLAHLEILEAATWTTNTGTLINIYNSYRDSTNTSEMEEDKTATPAWQANMKMLQDVSVPAGTVLAGWTEYAWAAKKIEADRRADDELIIKSNVQYIVRITSDDGNKGLGLSLNWYEHTFDKTFNANEG